MALEEDVVRAFVAAGRTLALAESVTGGLVAGRVTGVEGASRVLRGSLVTYTDGAKRDLLGVPAHVLRAHGAVSAPVARAMAEGARQRLRAHVAVALTGYADGAQAGLVFLALATRGGASVVERRFEGGRAQVRAAAADEALRLALSALTPA